MYIPHSSLFKKFMFSEVMCELSYISPLLSREKIVFLSEVNKSILHSGNMHMNKTSPD